MYLFSRVLQKCPYGKEKKQKKRASLSQTPSGRDYLLKPAAPAHFLRPTSGITSSMAMAAAPAAAATWLMGTCGVIIAVDGGHANGHADGGKGAGTACGDEHRRADF